MDGSDFVMPVIVGGAWFAATATYIYLKAVNSLRITVAGH